MATLTAQQKRFIVLRLACFRTPTQVVEEVREQFGVEVSRQQVQHYDPTSAQKPAKRWAELFEDARWRYYEVTTAVAVSHQRYRLDVLQEDVLELGAQIRAAKKMGRYGNPKLVAELIAARCAIIEQAAKEVGGMYTNLRRIESDPARTLAAVLGVPPEDLEEL